MEVLVNNADDLAHSGLNLNRELAAISSNTRRLAVWSVVVHLALGVFLMLGAGQAPLPADSEEFEITEVTWLEEVIEPEVPETPLQPAPTETAADIAPEEPDVLAQTEPTEPEPVITPAVDQLAVMQDRLARLMADDAGRREITTAAASTLRRPDPTALGAMVPRQAPPTRNLNRAAPSPSAPPKTLKTSRPQVVEAAVQGVPGRHTTVGQVPLQEVLPGISLGGEITGRKLISTVKPGYPEWAKRDGVEVIVQLFFTVLPDGSVKENILIERTSGFADFDGRARSALRDWRFESLPAGQSEQQWGRIEFNYQIKAAG
jgi:TonB family protein